MKPADPTPKTAVWFTPREAAEYLKNVGVDILDDGCAAGGLKITRLGYRTIRLRRERLDACKRRQDPVQETQRDLPQSRPAECDCPWYGKYKHVNVNLANWRGSSWIRTGVSMRSW